ncbi:MAG: hypothetical protein KAI28_10655 [Sphingomonadales bacterium]|nr:hypothetical protein [Sphingomonadales bacterium]
MSKKPTSLNAFIKKELSRKQGPVENRFAAEIAALYGESALGVLYYGSCLRTGELEDKVLDFYVLVDDYKKAYDGHLGLAWGNALIPPNVFYAETEMDGLTLRAKYAVISLDDFKRRSKPSSLNISIWARFSQPSVLLRVKDSDVVDQVVEALSNAITTMLGAALPFVPRESDPSTLWSTAFELTYGAELRSEKAGKGKELFLLDQTRYEDATSLALDLMGVPYEGHGNALTVLEGAEVKRIWPARRKWMLRRWNGKTVSLLRLIKASFTFKGGIDYLAWKISRHSGVKLTVTPWQRKHPILAGLMLFWTLRKKGAFR